LPTGLFYHAACQDHLTPDGHPESPDRLAVILDRLDHPDFNALKKIPAEAAPPDRLALVHDEDYIRHVTSHIPGQGHYDLDQDTFLSPRSMEAALGAVGATCQAIDQVMAGQIDNAFCAIRPPGHHAEPGRAMGFCLFNNIAVGAIYARTKHFRHRVAILDFDVHHGNGSQSVVAGTRGLFYGSTHQSPLYPGTGHVHDRGDGVIVNSPLAAGSGSRAFRRTYSERIFPELDKFNPDFILVSAGFDGHAQDPLADLKLMTDDFFWIGAEIKQIAGEKCQGRMVSCLEGGYNTAILGENVAAYISALMR